MENIFDPRVAAKIIARINQLTPDSKPLWGKMSVSKMLAHCNITYELVYTDKHPKPNAFMKFILKLLVKKKVINEEPYKQNGPTAPAFIIKDDKDFAAEKARLIDHINTTQQHGRAFFDHKESHSFGPLTADEWNNMFYKHLDHHLRQFGV
ncbi:hypothetical protein BH09BAC6_BH09BAC6_09350 [soil metagenome]|jgi:hypothetical protein